MTSTTRCIFAAACFVFALLALWRGMRDFATARRSSGWPRVAGEIVSAEIVESDFDSEMGWRPRITYRYRVAGQVLNGERVAFGMYANFYSNLCYAERYVRRYPAGQRVYVSHAPDDPAVSVLEPGITPWAFLAITLALSLFVASALLMLA